MARAGAGVFRVVPTTADIGLEVDDAGSAARMVELLVEGQRSLICPGLRRTSGCDLCSRNIVRSISFTGFDGVELMVDLLSRMLLMFDTERLLAESCSVKRVAGGDGNGPMEMDVVFEMIEFHPGCHTGGKDLKAVTYHRAEFDPGRGFARVIFDI